MSFTSSTAASFQPPVMFPATANGILVQYGRVGKLAGTTDTNTPPRSDTEYFLRGYHFSIRTGSEDVVHDIDGTVANTLITLDNIRAMVIHVINRGIGIQGLTLEKIVLKVFDAFAERFPEKLKPETIRELIRKTFTTQSTLLTMWRHGFIPYLAGMAYALDRGVSFCTFGWSRRIAMMCHQDPAARLIFFGPRYTLASAIKRAKDDPKEKMSEEERTIDFIEEDLMNLETFMVTAHVGQAVEKILEKLDHLDTADWTSDEVNLLRHIFNRKTSEMLLPKGGYKVTAGAKNQLWADVLGKRTLADIYVRRGLLDDSEKHWRPFSLHGRSIVVRGGKEAHYALFSKEHALKLLAGTTLYDAALTQRILKATEAPFIGCELVTLDPDIPLGVAAGHQLSNFQLEMAQYFHDHPAPDSHPENDVSELKIDMAHMVDGYVGVHWKLEKDIRNFFSKHSSAGDQFLMGALLSLFSIAQNPSATQWTSLFPALIFGGMEALQEAILGAPRQQNPVHLLIASYVTAWCSLTATQAIDPHFSVSPFLNIPISLMFAVLQSYTHRAITPLTSRAKALQIVDKIEEHLDDKDYTSAQKKKDEMRRNARYTSAASAAAFSVFVYLLLK